MQNPTVQLKNALGAGTSSTMLQNLYSTMADNNISAMSYKATFKSVQMQQTAFGTSMSMTEYQVYISAKIDDIPFGATRPFDEQAIKISDAGWLKMKNDPAHEQFVLNAIARSRQMIDEMFNRGGVGNYSILSFDDTQNVGSNMFSKMFGGSLESARSTFEYESWNAFWISRAQRAEQAAAIEDAQDNLDALLEMLDADNKLPTV
ncbi:MAG: hypothetical protein IJU71_11685 [Selenomonadaceae bacterium]|nr:hypothetical protein [Selenomonadaceae bacterium]